MRTTAGFDLAPTDPVARVQLIGALPHLDRPFDYAVTADTAAAAPGMRVKVRLAGRETDGIVLERCATPSTDRPLAPLHRLVSEQVVITPQMLRVCAEVAERCAGTVGDVLRLALPPRHARAERADQEKAAAEAAAVGAAGGDAHSAEAGAADAAAEPPSIWTGTRVCRPWSSGPGERARCRVPPWCSTRSTRGQPCPPRPSAVSPRIAAPW
ncbi:hypothetical protein [Brachybacterium sillae]|uniref:primosomal protein N' family DNA-binding protein n=1 Tax=Brachybacterium sillae TaxID=2810536 RepID=UPI00217D87D2|nr:hypothetical protein [Brachybacterium sillae]